MITPSPLRFVSSPWKNTLIPPPVLPASFPFCLVSCTLIIYVFLLSIISSSYFLLPVLINLLQTPFILMPPNLPSPPPLPLSLANCSTVSTTTTILLGQQHSTRLLNLTNQDCCPHHVWAGWNTETPCQKYRKSPWISLSFTVKPMISSCRTLLMDGSLDLSSTHHLKSQSVREDSCEHMIHQRLGYLLTSNMLMPLSVGVGFILMK